MADTSASSTKSLEDSLRRLGAAISRIETALANRLDGQTRDRDVARTAAKEAQALKAENADLRAANRALDERLAAAARRIVGALEG
ncbi:MAG: hypothetical protein EXQ90_03900 [Rhodospirillales bacterium]|nr:hypothetical protein [Rhodospirillales bacterium]